MTPRPPMALSEIVLCVGFSLALPIGQSMFKYAAIYNQRLSGSLVMRVLTNWPLIGAFAWYGLTALFWFYILTRVPLSTAYAFSIIGSGLVPLIAWALFKEQIHWQFAAGYVLMLAGFFLTMQGRA